ncbi:ribonuclease H-like domain-containing protein [Tanacetum coccineum]
MAEPNDYITATRKNFVSNDNEGRMVEKCIVEIQETFLVKIRDNSFNGNIGENAFKHIDKFLEVVRPIKINGLTQDRFRLSVFPVLLAGVASEWFIKECIGLITTWDNMMSKVLQERRFRSLHSSTEINPRGQVKSISTAKADFSEIRLPFPRRLQNFICDDWREAQDVKILNAYDHTLPQKEKDPGRFTLPCFIYNIYFDKSLVDLGASVSIMPFSTYTSLGLGNLSHTRLTIELADQTIKQPRGIAENVLVRIGKFIFPIDFIILDIPEDDDVPLILGRPFLSTAHSKIDVFKRKITFRGGDESFDPIYGGYIELNDFDTPLETKTDRDDFVPIFVKTGSYKMKFSCVIGYKYVIADLLPSLPINLMSKSFYYSIFGDKDAGKSHAGTLIDEPVFVGSFSIISGFTIIDDDDMTKDVVLGMKFCKKYASCQRIMKRFALGNNCERIIEDE